MINVKGALRDLKGVSKKLGKKQVSTAVVKAINKSMVIIHGEAVKAIQNEYNVPAAFLNRIKIIQARSEKMEGSLAASKKPLPLDAFSPRFEMPQRSGGTRKRAPKGKKRQATTGNTGKGVSIEVHRGSRQVIPFAFMIPNAKPRVFARGAYRTGGSYGFVRRYKRINKKGSDIPIKPLITVTVNAMLINDKTKNHIQNKSKTIFPRYLTKELEIVAKKLSEH